MHVYTKEEMENLESTRAGIIEKALVDEEKKAAYLAEFEDACTQFRVICQKIGEFIGVSDFKGGFDEYDVFINSEAAKSDPMTANSLANCWSGMNQKCMYSGAKAGYGQPDWWKHCWGM